MLKVSKRFTDAIKNKDRSFKAKLLLKGIEYENDSVFKIEYSSDSITGQSFAIGSTFSNNIKITLSKIVEGIKQLDKITYQLGIVVEPNVEELAEMERKGYTWDIIEYVSMGTFFVTSYNPDRNDKKTIIEASDAMLFLDGPYNSKLIYPATIKNVALEIANLTGSLIDEGSFQRLPNIAINKLADVSYRQALGFIAQFQIGYATFDRFNKLSMRKLSDPTYKVTTCDYFEKGLVKQELLYKIDGVSCEVKKGDETIKLYSGKQSGNQVELRNDAMTQDRLNDVFSQLQTINFYPYTLKWRGHPALESGDWITLDDTAGNFFKVPNLSYSLSFSGGLSANSGASVTTNSEVGYQYRGPISQQLADIVGWQNAAGGWTYSGFDEPKNPREGDTWFKPNGPDTEIWIYENGEWVFKTSTADITAAKIAADKADITATTALKTADLGVAKANSAQLDVNALNLEFTGLKLTVQDKADKTQVTQLATQWQQTTDLANGHTSQISSLGDQVNIRVVKNDVINQLNISTEGILIAGKKVQITGDTYIANGVIKTAHIADASITNAKIGNISADKINVGTLNAGNVNIINLNASNITTGTISGANLSINLSTGIVNFQKGRINSSSGNIDINIDKGYMSVSNDVNKVMIKGGQLQFVQPSIFDISSDPYFSISNSGGAQSFSGASLVGRDFLSLANSANNTNMFDVPLGVETFAGISFGKANDAWRPTKIGGADRGIILSGGTAMSSEISLFNDSPSIRVGYSPSSNTRGNRILLDGEYVHIWSAYFKTTSSSANVVVAGDGALIRSTSASKYKTNIQRFYDTSVGDKLLNLPYATWLDKADIKRYREDNSLPIPKTNFGMIAEDLAGVGLEYLVVRGADNQLEGIQYDRLAVALIPIIKELKQEVETLKAQVA